MSLKKEREVGKTITQLTIQNPGIVERDLPSVKGGRVLLILFSFSCPYSFLNLGTE